MRVALLIAGYLRNYDKNIEFIQSEILNKFENVDVYLHITKDENNEDKYLNRIEESDVKYIIEKLNPTVTLIEDNITYVSDRITNNTINHWAKLYKLNELKKIRENETSLYDLVIRYRPDLEINSKNIFNLDFDNGMIYIPEDSKIDKNKLINLNDNYLCDALAFGNSKSMNRYFDISRYYGDKIHPVSETALYNYLRSQGIAYRLIDVDYNFILSKCNVFAICGDSGSGKSTLSTLLKNSYSDSFMLECDRYHKWERYNNNWDKITHLNPEANYITKMEDDIFNLKVGNQIHQVDYDHSTGKFTDKQRITPSNNLIVCGLHSLYGDNKLYDVKIYMDTESNLKKKWKLKRDVIERGYTIGKVLDSMKKRENDYQEYILPQKFNADIIVKFFTNDFINFDDLTTVETVSLELSINKRCANLDELLTRFNVIDYKIYENGEFITIIFNEYTPINFGFNTNNTFYDYILYFIFNLTFTN